MASHRDHRWGRRRPDGGHGPGRATGTRSPCSSATPRRRPVARAGLGALGAPGGEPVPAAALLPAALPRRARARAARRGRGAGGGRPAARSTPWPGAPDSSSPGVGVPTTTDHEALTGRRPVVEAVLAAAAQATPGVTVRRGVAVQGLLTGVGFSARRPPCHRGAPGVGRGDPRRPRGRRHRAALPVAGLARGRRGPPPGRGARGHRASSTTAATSASPDGTTPPHHGPVAAGLRQPLGPHPAGRQRHVGRGPGGQRRRQRPAGTEERRHAGPRW